jgi:hypothetical protein
MTRPHSVEVVDTIPLRLILFGIEALFVQCRKRQKVFADDFVAPFGLFVCYGGETVRSIFRGLTIGISFDQVSKTTCGTRRRRLPQIQDSLPLRNWRPSPTAKAFCHVLLAKRPATASTVINDPHSLTHTDAARHNSKAPTEAGSGPCLID